MRTMPLLLLTTTLATAQTGPDDFQQRYTELRQATLNGDLNLLRTFYLPDARIVDTTGQPIPLNLALQSSDPTLVHFETLNFKLNTVAVTSDTATIQVSQQAQFTVTPLAGTRQVVSTATLSQDLWRKVDGQWRIAGSRLLESETRTGGQVIRQQAPPLLTAEERQARQRALATTSLPIQFNPAGTTPDELSWLGDLIQGVQVLGAGEGSHGTAEHFQLKARIFQDLVTRHGFTVLALEDSFRSGDAADRYVRGEGPDDADTATRHLQISVWQTQEVRDLLRWMRTYNRTRGTQPELRVVGIDMQDPYGSLQTLSALAPQNARLQAAIAPLNTVTRAQWLDLANHPARQTALTTQLVTLQAAVNALPLTTPQRTQLIHLTQTVRQGLVFWSGFADFNQANMIRDAAMSANVRFAFDTLFPGQRGLLWAHNFHVAKVPAQGQAYTSLGQHLQQAWGKRYRALGFSFAGGELRAFSADPAHEADGLTVLQAPPAPDDSLDQLVDTGAPAAYLNLARARQHSTLRTWLDHPVAFAGVGAVYAEGLTTHVQVNLAQAFDGIILVRRSSATRLLESK